MNKSSPERTAWMNMRKRCFNPKNPEYKNYGGRGITVCDRWLSFEAFLEDMGERPSSKHTLDRYPDNNGNYEPGNCAWRTQKEQMQNRRVNHWITFDGRTQTISAWAEETGFTPGKIWNRLNLGWSVERALTQQHSHTPATHCKNGHPRVEANRLKHAAGGTYCRLCALDGKKKYYQKHRAERIAYAKEYHRLHTVKTGKKVVTHCVHGHEYTPENTYLDGDGWKRCRTCKKAHDQKAREKRRGRSTEPSAD
jgi:hypothetical protein